MPALANVALTDTFDTWRIRTNQIVVKVNDEELRLSSAFTKANDAPLAANNYSIALATTGNNYTNAVGTAGNNYTIAVGTAANNYMIGVQNDSNTAVGTGANAYALTLATAGNNFTIALQNGSNTAVGAGANAYATSVGAGANTVSVAAFAKANAALANATTTYVGNLTIVGNTVIGTTLEVTGSVTVAKANVLSQTLTDGATINWNTASGQIATVTLAGNRTMAAPTNLKIGTYILHVVQDGAGERTLSWNGVFKWPAGVAPTLTTTGGRRDLFSFVCDGTNLYGSFLPDVR